MNVLVTGAAGYIGSHACARLLQAGHRVVGVDNLFRGHEAAIDRCRAAHAGGDASRLVFARGDCGDTALLTGLITQHRVDAVMHFAALAYVGESVPDPLGYYHHNVTGLLGLLRAVNACPSVTRLVFSSSCSTYGEVSTDKMPVTEGLPLQPVSPYGRSKLMGERIIADFAESLRLAKRAFAWRALRYFNVAGCDPSGQLGEDHTPETHLVPLVLRVALGVRESISIFGTDYPTPDGTCIRDYVHVDDLAAAHVAVAEWLTPTVGESVSAGSAASGTNAPAFNLGIGRGYSVREVIEASRKVTGRAIKVVEAPRRAGDPAMVYADPSLVMRTIKWTPRFTSIEEIVRTAWAWMQKHPRGYGG